MGNTVVDINTFFKEDQYQDLVEDDLAYFLKILKTWMADIHNPVKETLFRWFFF